MMGTRLQIRLGDQTVPVTVAADGAIAVGSGDAFQVDATGPGMYRVSDGTRQWTIAVAGSGESRWVFVDGAVFQGEAVAEGGGRRRARSGTDDVMAAPMPATVVKILVDAGADVAKGDTVLVLEAMKMELPVRAPRAGVVKAINCSQGELVQPGVPLVELA